MLDFLRILNNREISVAIWTAVFFAWALSLKDVRSSLGDVLRAFFKVKLCLPLFAFVLYAVGVAWLLARLHLWEWSVLKETLIWFFGTAIVLFFGVAQAVNDPKFFRKTVHHALKLTVLLEIIATNYVGSLPFELVLVPVLTVLSCTLIVAQTKDEFKAVAKLLSGMASFAGLCIMTYALWSAFQHLGDFKKPETLLQITVGPLLTLLVLPFIYLLALWIEYEGQFIRLGYWLGEKPELLSEAKRAVLKVCGLNLQRLVRLKGQFYMDLQESESIEQVADVVQAWALHKRGAEESEFEDDNLDPDRMTAAMEAR